MTYNLKIQVTCDQGEILDSEYKYVSFDEMRDVDINSFIDSAETYATEQGFDKVYANEAEADMAVADFSSVDGPNADR